MEIPMRAFFPRAVLAALLLAVALPASGEEKPVWEAGLGVGVMSFPEYRGSARQRSLVLPTPYLVYRGQTLRTDRSGLHGRLFDTNRVELNLSFSASLPVESSNHGARRGMPDLQPTVEFGPSLIVHLWRNEPRGMWLDARLPVRAAYTVRGGVDYAGLVFSPALNFNARLGRSGWNLGLMSGPAFANTRQHNYFYEVKPRYATFDRPAYRASGGYSGTQFIASLSRRFDGFWVGGFVRYDTLRGAAFDDSPLVERKHAWFGGLGISWILGQSKQTVNVGAED
jgi:outer membrane scaffolding protein for murein synthesis (MipA/OmpV family)